MFYKQIPKRKQQIWLEFAISQCSYCGDWPWIKGCSNNSIIFANFDYISIFNIKKLTLNGLPNLKTNIGLICDFLLIQMNLLFVT